MEIALEVADWRSKEFKLPLVYEKRSILKTRGIKRTREYRRERTDYWRRRR